MAQTAASASPERQASSCGGFLLFLLGMVIVLPLLCWGAFRVIISLDESSAYTQPVDGTLASHHCPSSCTRYNGKRARAKIKFTYTWDGRTYAESTFVYYRYDPSRLCIRPDQPEKYLLLGGDAACGDSHAGAEGTAELVTDAKVDP